MRKLTKFVFGTLFGTMVLGMTAFASEFSVTDVSAILYTTAEAELLADTDMTAVVLDKNTMPDGAPILVTGITSNGYFRVDLDGTYYIAGNGLVEGSGISTGTGAAPAKTPVATPVQNAGKYVCVIEEGDIELYKKHTYANWFTDRYPRTDMTSHPNYIAMRDEIEAAIARGETSFVTNKYEQYNKYDATVGKNLTIDLIKAYAHLGYKFHYSNDCPTASMYNPYTGEQFAYIEAYFDKIF